MDNSDLYNNNKRYLSRSRSPDTLRSYYDEIYNDDLPTIYSILFYLFIIIIIYINFI